MDRESTDFTLHVFRVLLRICRTSKMTACSPPAVVASRTSFSLLGLFGIGRWHRSRSAQSAAGAPYRCTRWSALAAFSVASALSSLCHAVGTHRVRCRATPDSVATRGFEGFMSVCRLPTEARQRPREGAWCMHGWASLMPRNPVQMASTTDEMDGATATFRSKT